MKRFYLSLAARILLVYTMPAALWIFFSDYLLQQIVFDPVLNNWLQTWKGWGFVGITTIGLYIVMHISLRRLQRANTQLARLNRDLADHARQQEAVATLRQSALADTTIDALLDEAAMLLALTLEIEQTAIWELHPTTSVLVPRALVGWPLDRSSAAELTMEPGSLLAYTLQTSGPVCITELASDTRFAAPACLQEQGIVSGISLCIAGRSQPSGVLGVWSQQPRVFSDAECRFVQAIANVLSTAIIREEAEQELFKQKTLLECQSEASPDGILVVSPAGQILSFNQRFVEMWNIPPHLLRADTHNVPLQFVMDQLSDPQQFEARIRYLYAHRHETAREEIALKDGRVFDRYTAPVLDAEGRHYGRVWYYRDISAIRQTQETLRKSEAQFRAFFEQAPVGIGVSRQGKVVTVNPAYLHLFGYDSFEEVDGQPIIEHIMPEERASIIERVARRQRGEALESRFSITGLRKDGELFPTICDVAQIEMIDGDVASVAFFTDISDLEHTEAELRRVNRALSTLSQCNEVMIRASSEIDLLQRICESMVNQGGYSLAWVGFVATDDVGQHYLRPVAQAGDKAVSLTSGQNIAETYETRDDATYVSLQHGQGYDIPGVVNNATAAPWQTVPQPGYAGCVALPLVVGAQLIGMLHVCTTEAEAFDEQEVGLLMNLADNLSYGIDTLRSRIEREAAREALREREEMFRTLVESMNDIVFMLDREQRYTGMFGRWLERVGLDAEAFMGKTVHEITDNPRVELVEAAHSRALAGEHVVYEWIDSLSERPIYLQVSVSPIHRSADEVVGLVGVGRDITALKQAEEVITRRNLELADLNKALEQTQADLTRRNEVLVALNQVTRAVNRSLSLSDVLTTLKTLLVEQFRIPAGAVYMYHEADDMLVQAAAWGLPPTLQATLERVQVATAHNRRVVWEHETVVVKDLAAALTDWPLLLEHVPLPWCCYLGVPVLAQGEIQGVIDVFCSDADLLLPEQVAFFVTLGQQVGAAIQNARLFDEVRSGQERLRELSRRLVEVQETERHNIARELHDEVGQILTGLNLTLEMTARLPAEQITSQLQQAQTMVTELILLVREMSLQLRPPMLDDLGLLSALLWHFDRYTRQTGIEVVFKHSGIDERRFVPDVEIAVYRIVQEALTNVARYAGVAQVEVRIWTQQEMLSVQVQDAGRGFDPQTAMAKHTSSGLAGIRERVLLLGGDITIESAPGQGSYLALELPLLTP